MSLRSDIRSPVLPVSANVKVLPQHIYDSINSYFCDRRTLQIGDRPWSRAHAVLKSQLLVLIHSPAHVQLLPVVVDARDRMVLSADQLLHIKAVREVIQPVWDCELELAVAMLLVLVQTAVLALLHDRDSRIDANLVKIVKSAAKDFSPLCYEYRIGRPSS